MLKTVSTFIRPPVFPEDEDKTRKARYANFIAWAFLLVAIAYEIFLRVYANYSILDAALLVVAAVSVAGLVLLRKGHVQLASILLIALTWAACNGLAATGFGVKDSSYIINFAIILMAGLLLSWPASVIVTLLSVVSGFGLAYAEQNGLINVPDYAVTAFARDLTVVFFLNGILIFLLISGLETALRRSRSSLKALETANTSLSYTQSELQKRTDELTISNEQLENRTQKLHAIAIVTRTAASIRNFNTLLTSITGTISEELDYYHVGLFLLDELREYAILRSTNTEGGMRMLDRGYRVPVGQIHPVGFVAQTGQPRTVPLEDEAFAALRNPELPEMRSELVLPLKSGDQIIGVLDIQSAEGSAFVESDIATLSILADQVAITIQNSFLYEQSLSALRKAGIEAVQAAAEAWKGYETSVQTKGYFYDGIKSEPLKDLKEPKKGNNSLFVPVELRGQTIGRFKLNLSDPARQWTDDELAMVRATAERVALALEGARLLDEAQKRATREAFLSDVATKLSASFQLDSILRDTVQELGQTLKNSTVTFQLVNPGTPAVAVDVKRSNNGAAVE
jgi:GAF domain-containing protein